VIMVFRCTILKVLCLTPPRPLVAKAVLLFIFAGLHVVLLYCCSTLPHCVILSQCHVMSQCLHMYACSFSFTCFTI
jgi:hypothetical protein